MASASGRPRPRELNHLFVNNVRFWAILSIVAIHSSGGSAGWIQLDAKVLFALVTPFKFATVGFFLVSGFLMGERVDRRDPVEYLLRRLKRVFVPWSFWFVMFSAFMLLIRERHESGQNIVWMACTTAWLNLLTTAFWFVPNLLLGIAILLTFRRYLYSFKFGLALLAINLVYVVNLYTLWFTSAHTQALFGFVFYLWLGSYAAHNFEKISSFLSRIPTSVFVALSLLTGAAAYGEALVLLKLHNPDPLNTLRLSNQFFSICMVLLIFKFRRATWPAFMDVRNHTFGIYLSHSILLRAFTGLLRHLRSPFTPGSVYVRDIEGVVVWAVIFFATYSCALLVTRWLAGRYQWTVGLASRDVPRADLNIADGELMPSQ